MLPRFILHINFEEDLVFFISFGPSSEVKANIFIECRTPVSIKLNILFLNPVLNDIICQSKPAVANERSVNAVPFLLNRVDNFGKRNSVWSKRLDSIQILISTRLVNPLEQK
jgi:hypothetical protein